MRPVIHGGDIYQNEIELDFSVNINPFGIPEKVKEQCRNLWNSVSITRTFIMRN